MKPQPKGLPPWPLGQFGFLKDETYLVGCCHSRSNPVPVAICFSTRAPSLGLDSLNAVMGAETKTFSANIKTMTIRRMYSIVI
jgi:hypothetical protein